jgi:tetratricopeptide (TPR) repeat protein
MNSKRLFWVLGALAIVLILVASTVMLFISARLQQDLLTRQPQYDAPTLYNRGVEQFSKGDYLAAEQSLEQALTKQDDTTYRSQLAVVKYRLKKYQESIENYRQLIVDGKDASFAWNGIGNAYRDWSEVDTARKAEFQQEAIEAYKKAIALNAQYVAAYSNMALLYSSMGESEKAAGILDEGFAATGNNELLEIKRRLL